MQEILGITFRVTETFERLGVAYLVGGSLASSLHGIPRATMDADLVAVLSLEHVTPLAAALKDEFYLDVNMIRESIRRGTSFNLIHLQTMFKVDVFTPKKDQIVDTELKRGTLFTLEGDPPRAMMIASPEDMIVQKLHWYRMGGAVSERQWSDAMGIIKIGGSRLDRKYIEETAERLGVADLWRKLTVEAAHSE